MHMTFIRLFLASCSLGSNFWLTTAILSSSTLSFLAQIWHRKSLTPPLPQDKHSKLNDLYYADLLQLLVNHSHPLIVNSFFPGVDMTLIHYLVGIMMESCSHYRCVHVQVGVVEVSQHALTACYDFD